MAKQIFKISEKLKDVSENATVYFYDNGYMVEIGGHNHSGDWAAVKLMCKSLDDVYGLLIEIDGLPRDN